MALGLTRLASPQTATRILHHQLRTKFSTLSASALTPVTTGFVSNAGAVAAPPRLHIVQLTLSKCHIQVLYGPVFDAFAVGHVSVSSLVINATPLIDIRDGTLDAMADTLTRLTLISTRLTRVPPAISNLTSLTELTIDGSDIAFLAPDSFASLSSLQRLTLASGRLGRLAAHAFTGLRQLKHLSLHHNALSVIEKGAFADLGNSVESLDISYNQIGPRFEVHHFVDLRRLLWLNASENALTRLEGRTFARNSLLRVLNVAANRLTSIDANSLRGMRFLRRLYLADNAIRTIGRASFRSISRIGTIDLARNALTRIDAQMFADFRFIDTIDVSANNISHVGREAFKNIYLTSVNLSHNAIASLGPALFRNAENMTSLDLSHNVIATIDPDAFDVNSYAADLDLTFNRLPSMDEVPLRHMRGLQTLNVSRNVISDVGRATFPDGVLLSLHTIDLSRNVIAHIASNVFAPLLALRRLDLSHNALSSVASSTFGALPSLLTLDLSHNAITDAATSTFTSLTSARVIDLSHNRIINVPMPSVALTRFLLSHNRIGTTSLIENGVRLRGPAAWARKRKLKWPTMNSLIELDLAHNVVGNLFNLAAGEEQHENVAFFDHLTVLQTLDLRHNGLTRVPRLALSTLRSLRTLNLDGNAIVTLNVTSAFGKLDVLADLSLAANGMTNVTGLAFDKLQQLQNLSLASNKLSELQPEVFRGLSALANIDLSNNRLAVLQNRSHSLFHYCLSLRRVDVSHNDIVFLGPLSLPWDRWTKYGFDVVSFAHNKIGVLTRDWLPAFAAVAELNLSHNAIDEIRPNSLANLTSLHRLDLSDNRLTDDSLDHDDFRWPPALSILSLRRNSLTSIQRQQHWVSALPATLTHLDVSGNSITDYPVTLNSRIFSRNVTIDLSDNPLRCDCTLRPLVAWLASPSATAATTSLWTRVTCATPSYLSSQSVADLVEAELRCLKNVSLSEKFPVSEDIKFRNINRHAERIKVSWFVTTNADVADFRLELRDGGTDASGNSNSAPNVPPPPPPPRSSIFGQASQTAPTVATVFTQDLSYTTRFQALDGVPPDKPYSICLLTRNSQGHLRRGGGQCRDVTVATASRLQATSFTRATFLPLLASFVTIPRL